MKITKEVVVPNYGLEGTQGPDGKPAIYTTVTNQNIVLNAQYQGLPSDYSKANGSIQVFEGDKEVTQQATYTLKQTLNVAATLDFNKFKVTHVSADNGMFIVTVKYKEFVSDIMITTNVVRNGQSGLDTYIHKAWSWSADGTDRFTTEYPNENLVSNTQKEFKLLNATNNVSKLMELPLNINPTEFKGKKVRLSAYVIVKNAKPRTTVPNQTRIGVDINYITSSVRVNHTVWKNLTDGENFEGYITSSDLMIPLDVISLGGSASYIQANGDYLEVKHVKYELGDSVTIYTPSPKDDYENAYPKYDGYYSSNDPVQSTNPSDYTWSVIRGETGVGVKSTVIRYAINPQGDTPPTSEWVSQVPTLVKGQFLWTETTWSYTDNTSEKGYSVTYISKDGQQGPPTGIIESPTIPTEVYQGMLWKNTGNLSGFITDTTYIYRGSKWEKYIFTADNIYADNLAAITASLGDVTGGSFTGGKFINNFIDVPLLYNGTSKATGQTKIENGQITIAGKIDNTFNFVTKYTVDAISSTIYYPNSGAVMKMFSITPDGFLLADHQNGFSGQLLASSLTKTPWVDIPMRSGYSGTSHNMPKYKITYNLDGTRTISFRGQIVKTSSAGVIDMEAGTNHFYGDMPVNVRPNVEANGYGVTNSGNGCRIWVTQQGGMGARIGITKTDYVDLSNLSYIID